MASNFLYLEFDSESGASMNWTQNSLKLLYLIYAAVFDLCCCCSMTVGSIPFYFPSQFIDSGKELTEKCLAHVL